MFRNTFYSKKKEATAHTRQEYHRLRHELFCLWDFIGQEGLWIEAREYIEEHADDHFPFEV